MYQARSRFECTANVMPWVFAIARHLLIDRTRTRRLEEPFDEESSSSEPQPDAIAECTEIAGRLRRVLARLPAEHRAAFELVRQEGLSVAEAARRLGATPCAVKLRTYRAAQALRAELEAA